MIQNHGPDPMGILLFFVVLPAVALIAVIGDSFYAGRRWERRQARLRYERYVR